VSDRALYVPATKRFRRYFQRIPLSQVQSVTLQKDPLRGVWVLAAFIVAVGLAATYWMLEPVLARGVGRVSGWPFVIVVVGLVVPFAHRGRNVLVVSHMSGSFKWRVITVAGLGKDERLVIQERILEVCGKVGLPVRDDRSKV
jgi:apolipoprotein N-acyltransferase